MTLIERSLSFTNKFSDKITNKTQLQRFLESLNYVLDYYPNISCLAKPLHDSLKTNPIQWSDLHTSIVKQIKQQVQTISLLYLANSLAPKIVETYTSDLGYGGILKTVQNNKEQIIQYTFAHWNDCQKNYSTIKKRDSFNCSLHYKISKWFIKSKIPSTCWLQIRKRSFTKRCPKSCFKIYFF